MFLSRFLSPLPVILDPVLDDHARVFILSILCVIEADLSFIREQMQIAMVRRDGHVCASAELIRTHLAVLKENGYIEDREQRFGEIPWLLTVLLERVQIHIGRGSYPVYRATEKGRKALNAHRRGCKNVEIFEWWS